MTDPLTGYAYKCARNGIDLRTVTDTERGAKVNALMVQFNFRVRGMDGDDLIERTFKDKSLGRGKIVPIEIREAQ